MRLRGETAGECCLGKGNLQLEKAWWGGRSGQGSAANCSWQRKQGSSIAPEAGEGSSDGLGTRAMPQTRAMPHLDHVGQRGPTPAPRAGIKSQRHH